MKKSQSRVDSRDPVFISYRQSDGSELAVAIAWALRAAGVPVWHDQSDLPPGDTERRLQEALASGLSGAVLMITPEIAQSLVVREIELPRLLELAQDASFTLSLASIVEREDGKLDYDAPDVLLQQPPGTLSRFKQQRAHAPEQRAQIAHDHARRRMQASRADVEAHGGVLQIDVQTRIPPFAARADAHLVLRLRPPREGDRRPNRRGLDDLGRFLADLPQLIALAGAGRLEVRGGAHLSVAFALGAAVPTTLVGPVAVVDTGGAVWTLNSNPEEPADTQRALQIISDDRLAESDGRTVIYLDLLPSRSDPAFENLVLLDEQPIGRRVHVRTARQGNLDPTQAPALVGEMSHLIRDIAGQQRTNAVHLLLRCPWTIALLLGRTLNTLSVHLYEWEDGPADDGTSVEPRYLPSLVLQSGGGGSPIRAVTLPMRVDSITS